MNIAHLRPTGPLSAKTRDAEAVNFSAASAASASGSNASGSNAETASLQDRFRIPGQDARNLSPRISSLLPMFIPPEMEWHE